MNEIETAKKCLASFYEFNTYCTIYTENTTENGVLLIINCHMSIQLSAVTIKRPIKINLIETVE